MTHYKVYAQKGRCAGINKGQIYLSSRDVSSLVKSLNVFVCSILFFNLIQLFSDKKRFILKWQNIEINKENAHVMRLLRVNVPSNYWFPIFLKGINRANLMDFPLQENTSN
jgi:hypothetical protein